jgi:DNA-binding beta-propeller fold protein YncE
VPFQATARRFTTHLTALGGSGFGIARTPDGYLLVTLIDRAQVQRISIASPGNSVGASVGFTPVVIGADAAGQFAFAANMGGSLSIINVASMTASARVPIPGEAHSLGVSPRGDRVYVTNTTNRFLLST